MNTPSRIHTTRSRPEASTAAMTPGKRGKHSCNMPAALDHHRAVRRHSGHRSIIHPPDCLASTLSGLRPRGASSAVAGTD